MTDGTGKARTPQKWRELVEDKPNFPSLILRWMILLRNLAIHTPANEQDFVGHLIMTNMVMSLSDVDDIMSMSHRDSHIGAHKLLRSLYERIVTLKYISENPDQAEVFMEFDSIDTEKIMAAIKAKTGMEMQENSRKNLAKVATEARKKYKQNPCPVCGEKKPFSWTPLNSKDMADRVGLGHMYFYAFLVPSKLIHPTYWSVREASGSSALFNTLNVMHELIVQLVLIHRRHFANAFGVTPMMNKAINDFLATWTICEGSFNGLLTRSYTSPNGGESVYYG